MSQYSSSGRVDFVPSQFDNLIHEKGMRVLWEEAMMCNCVSDTGQPDFNCPLCGGSGFLYLPSQETVVASTNMTGNKNFENIGMRETGTAYVTALSTDLMGYHDRLTFVDFKSKYSQVATLQYGKSLPLKRPVKQILVAQIGKTVYNPELDLHIINDGWNIELADKLKESVSDTEQMSLLYITSPVYCIIDIVHELRATMVQDKRYKNGFAELPKQFLLKREDFMYGHNPNTSDS